MGFFKDFNLFLDKGKGRKRGRETSMGCLLHIPNWGPSLQPRHVPWLGIEPATFQFTGRCSNHWGTPAREPLCFHSTNISEVLTMFQARSPLIALSHNPNYWINPRELPGAYRSGSSLFSLAVSVLPAAAKRLEKVRYDGGWAAVLW